MTTAEYKALSVREKDALVAEHVMDMPRPDWVPTRDEVVGAQISSIKVEWLSWPWEINYWGSEDEFFVWTPRPFHTDIAAAWEVVEEMKGEPWGDSFGWGWTPEIVWRQDGDERAWHVAFSIHEAEDDTAPEAICLAALRAKRVVCDDD